VIKVESMTATLADLADHGIDDKKDAIRRGMAAIRDFLRQG
jgi:hypothetical protein